MDERPVPTREPDEFAFVVEEIPGLVWTAQPDGNFDFLNKSWSEYTGLSAAEVCSSGWSGVVHSEDLSHVLNTWNTTLTSGKPLEMEARLRRLDGDYRWFLIRASALTDASGNVTKLSGINIDIDDRKKAENDTVENTFRLIVDSLPVPVAVTDATGGVEALNRPTLEYFGKTLEELKGWKSSEVVHPDDLEHTVAAQIAAHQAGSAYNVESRHRRADGVYRWFNVLGLPLRDARGNILHWCHLQIDIDSQKRAEDALRANENDLSRIINTIPALAWSARPDGSAEFLNQYYLEFVGLTREQSLEWDWTEALHPDDRKRVLKAWEISLAKGEGGELEARFRRHDGVYRWFLVGVNPLRDEFGNVVKWYGQNTDITELKLALEKLQAREELLDLAQKAARAMAFDWQIQNEFNTWTPEQENLYGLEPGTFDGTFESWKKLIHPKDWPHVVTALKRARETGDISAEYRVVWPDGSTHWLSANGQMFVDYNGQPRRMVGFTADITQRKLVEEELRRSEAFLAEGQHLSLTGTFLWRLDTDEIIFSDEARSIFGFVPDEDVTLRLIGARVHPEDVLTMNERIGNARDEFADQDFENRLRMPDGSVKYIHTIAHCVRNEDGGREYLGAIQDITERRISEEALSRARSELAHVARVTSLGALTASIAHEVNQPLAGIVTNASTCLRMLAAEPPNIDGARETARRTIRDGNRASDVITRLRSLFRKKEIPGEIIDLNEAAREVIALSRRDLQNNRVVLKQELSDDLPLVAGDRVQLQQVILNLLINASHAMTEVEDRPRDLLVRTGHGDDGDLLLTVRDSGTGFEPQSKDRLFDAFYTTKESGMGIGLHVSRSIIESHRGRLWAALNDGPGATFSFSIPRVDEGAAGATGMDNISH